ncbi:MaoC family dehydratase [Granulicoccus phenolivorans]|uniref:MaoC family dehydratase n=1 Tax=Granulicoccus phenolivorans TaxID=266854 RepID=UPI0003F7011F|nr:MaoC family dehydratase [Granulicoccus phenolivorans]
MSEYDVGGPHFEDLAHGQVFDGAPAVTLTEGLAATHQAILGDRMALPLDHHRATAVAGGALAHPGLVCDVSIGQSTLATHHVRANLFYRGLRFHRFPLLGDTLSTRTEVEALKQNTVRPGRPATGLAVLRITTTDQAGRPVLDYRRCPMIPYREQPGAVTGPADDVHAVTEQTPPGDPTADWNFAALGSPGPALVAGDVYRSSGDVVSSAPELARLTLNIAAAHHDVRTSPEGRLVYGGHTIGIALAQATRAVPGLLAVLGWESCDHTGPVREGDLLTSRLHVEAVADHPASGGQLVTFRSLVNAGTDAARPVLDWVFQAVVR